MSPPLSAKQREVQRITESLASAIVRQRLPPGARLVEAQIVDALQANRNHVQAALQRLALQQIVEIEPHRGARVAQPTAREAREIFIARQAIEHAILAQITPEALRAGEAAMAAQRVAERAALQGTDRREGARALSEFHRLLAALSGNQVLSDILENLLIRSSLIVALYQRGAGSGCQCEEHEAILTALRRGALAEAQRQMREHLQALAAGLDLHDGTTGAHDLRDALSD
ncbi:GntR family transcriptional regulator [Pantoea sp. 1.19]|uniref:GntR family transcriptional regulator n=1 Tax=Pantoea sp. 1.19 TaxID=1925589 RepID=UPI000948D739|nr:GntR family transcriptional regulator [Pantoea sp. 1.19]